MFFKKNARLNKTRNDHQVKREWRKFQHKQFSQQVSTKRHRRAKPRPATPYMLPPALLLLCLMPLDAAIADSTKTNATIRTNELVYECIRAQWVDPSKLPEYLRSPQNSAPEFQRAPKPQANKDVSVEPIKCIEPELPAGFPPIPESLDLPTTTPLEANKHQIDTATLIETAEIVRLEALSLPEGTRQKKALEASIELFSMALESKPSLQAYAGRASDYKALGMYRDAIKDFTSALNTRQISEKETRAKHFTERGHCLLCLGKYELALADFSQSIRICPSSIAYYYRAYTNYLQKNFADALSDATILIKEPQSSRPKFIPPSSIYALRANAYRGLRKCPEAISDFRRALKETPNDSNIHLSYADFLTELGKDRDAELQYILAIKTVKLLTERGEIKQSFAHMALAYAHFRLNRNSAALTEIEKAIQLRPDSAKAHMLKSKIAQSLKNEKLAKDELAIAFRLGNLGDQAWLP